MSSRIILNIISDRRFAIEQSIRREQSIQREEQLREFRQLQVNLRERGRRLAIQPSTSTTAKSNKPSASQSKPEETSRPVKEEGPYKILKKVQPKPVETKKPEPVPSTSGAIKKTNITILKRKGKKSYLQRPKLNLNTINPENVHQLSNLDILNVLRSYFTEEQWSNATPEHRIHLKNLFFTYIQNEQYRKRYTLGEFLREHVPEDTPAVEADVHRALGDTDIAKRTDIIPLTREESRQGFINLHHMRALARSRRDRIMILPSIPETEEEYESSEKSETDTVKESASKSESSTDDNEEEEENGEEEEDNDEVDEDDDDEVDEDDENEGNGDDDDDTDHGNADNALQKPTSVTHIVKKKISSLFPKK
ncbi:uncharacterized protein LOC143197356 [Rhynchophorus ferrugineus]|uniref:uncharacterized protein LOC143197356 n=1 Tax=Rhynchophorus ferrugineus TaxID=354439 RepID=UPI003FCD5E26